MVQHNTVRFTNQTHLTIEEEKKDQPTQGINKLFRELTEPRGLAASTGHYKWCQQDSAVSYSLLRPSRLLTDELIALKLDNRTWPFFASDNEHACSRLNYYTQSLSSEYSSCIFRPKFFSRVFCKILFLWITARFISY